MNGSDRTPRTLIGLFGAVAILVAACGSASTSPAASTAASTAPAASASAAAAESVAPTATPIIVTPEPVAAGPGPNGGKVVRWFIGLGAGTQPPDLKPEADVHQGVQRLAEGRLHPVLRSSTTHRGRDDPEDRDRGRQRARTSSARSASKGLNLFPDQLLDLAAADRIDRLHPDRASIRSSLDFFNRSVRTAPRSACRSPSTRRSSSTTRTCSTRPACRTRRPRSATVRGQAVGHRRRCAPWR